MAIISLTTDFGEKDHFVGAIKGAIYSESEDVRIVDVSHSVSPFNVLEAAYILKNAYKDFPKGSIHVFGVDSERTPENRHIAVLLDDHFFVGADNGVIAFVAGERKPEKIVEINIYNDLDTIFPCKDVFVKVACHIARGGTLEVVGKPVDKMKSLKTFAPIINTEQDQVTGHVIYVDNYGNVVTNISRQLFENVRKGRDFELYARNYRFDKIHNKYSDIVNFSVEKPRRDDDGKRLAVFNSAGYIELAIYRSNLETVGGASSLLGLNYRDVVTIRFL
ncbi:SAM-dependent chlorinase/fluorinase [Sinomicrobium kalidii]|uniref:SAM hydrolase/SAM-dependent halogenase family protein n=1 Tax=Sinomicrobium kalidii TaxID=2900738 RepID=UPI001E4E06A2|nr:SAM-dependent chlorinase/fluorinase [Sinomicrobium kalidii]UGU16826.1 SAM-dependent chlorinase/fluorinase [Sinomicrobium kalidii]